LVFHAVFVHLERFAPKLLRIAFVAGLLWSALLILRGVIVHFERLRHRILHYERTTRPVAVGSRANQATATFDCGLDAVLKRCPDMLRLKISYRGAKDAKDPR
jgi:hypothetical protein